MPKLPKNNFSFTEAVTGVPKEGQRHRIMRSALTPGIAVLDSLLVANCRDGESIVANELRDRQVFLRMLETMLHEQGYPLDTQQIFRDVAIHYTPPEHSKTEFSNVFGSQHAISLVPFPETELQHKTSTILGPPETTTRYGFNFGFTASKDTELKYGMAYYTLDTAPFSVLQSYGVRQEMCTDYLEGFGKMASMAEHDYLHHLVSPLQQYCQLRFSPQNVLERNKKHPPVKDGEFHPLALHAQICARLFAEEKPATDGKGNPVPDDNGNQMMEPVGARRKVAVLKWAAHQFKQIADMQDEALAHAPDENARATIKEAVTYLAEIYAHRLFRVVPPHDPDLDKPLTLRETGTVTSVGAQADRIQLQMATLYHNEDPDLNHGMAGLRLLCATFLGPLYTQIHTKTSMRMERYDVLSKINGDMAMPSSKPRLPLASVVGQVAYEGMGPMKERYIRINDGATGVAR